MMGVHPAAATNYEDLHAGMARALLEGREVCGITYDQFSEQVTELWRAHGDALRAFADVFYASRMWNTMRWCGVPVHKPATDLWAMQEVFWRVKPTVVIETGTMYGGSALYYADLMTLMAGRDFRYRPRLVLTIDREPYGSQPAHGLIEYVTGDSLEQAAYVGSRVRPTDRVLVCLDSDHSAEHVRRELEAYAPLVTVGSYLVVEDTNLVDGPGEAMKEWLRGQQAPAMTFWPDHCVAERLLHTFHPNGYLLRVA